MNSPVVAANGPLLVSDFDGTMTDVDFYRIVLQRLLPPGAPTYWEEFRAGEITHFEALRRIFAAIPHPEAEVVEMLAELGLDPAIPTSIERLEAAGWQVIVVSAGCRWYIDQLFQRADIKVDVYASPGCFAPGQGLAMSLPEDSPYYSATHGIDKAAAIREAQQQGRRVAFAGNSESDLPAARLVPGDLLFACDELPELLTREGRSFRRFERWSEIADMLLAG